MGLCSTGLCSAGVTGEGLPFLDLENLRRDDENRRDDGCGLVLDTLAALLGPWLSGGLGGRDGGLSMDCSLIGELVRGC